MAASHRTSLGNFGVEVLGRCVAAGPAPDDHSVGIGVAAREWPTIGLVAGVVIAGDRGSLIAFLDSGEIDDLIAQLGKAKGQLQLLADGQPSGSVQ